MTNGKPIKDGVAEVGVSLPEQLPKDVLNLVMKKLTPVDQMNLYTASTTMQRTMDKVYNSWYLACKNTEKAKSDLASTCAKQLEHLNSLLAHLKKLEKTAIRDANVACDKMMKKDKKLQRALLTQKKKKLELEKTLLSKVLMQVKSRLNEYAEERKRIEKNIKEIEALSDALDDVIFGDFSRDYTK